MILAVVVIVVPCLHNAQDGTRMIQLYMLGASSTHRRRCGKKRVLFVNIDDLQEINNLVVGWREKSIISYFYQLPHFCNNVNNRSNPPGSVWQSVVRLLCVCMTRLHKAALPGPVILIFLCYSSGFFPYIKGVLLPKSHSL